jgi:hypothetical protein
VQFEAEGLGGFEEATGFLDGSIEYKAMSRTALLEDGEQVVEFGMGERYGDFGNGHGRDARATIGKDFGWLHGGEGGEVQDRASIFLAKARSRSR